jgi:hypothetical protein
MEISKRVKNAIEARIEATVKKHGLDATRLVMQRWAQKQREKIAIEREIAEKRKELEALARKKLG